MKCMTFLSDFRQFYSCSDWCNVFATCFNETGNKPWVDHCLSKFRQPSPFMITAGSNEVSSSVLRIRGRRCLPLWKNVFVVSVSHCNCIVDDNRDGMEKLRPGLNVAFYMRQIQY